MWGKGVEMRSSADHRAGTRKKRLLAKALTAAAVILTMAMPAAAEAANIGVDGPDFVAGVSGSPSGYKGESKLWFNDGFWWASMFDSTSSAYHIFKHDRSTQAWTDTGVETDNRDSSRQDTLWDGTHLWVSSHAFVENAGFNTTVNVQPMEFSRYSYNAGTDTYTLDFTVNIENDERSETLVFDQGPAGDFWATWVQQPAAGAGRQVLVSHTTGPCAAAVSCVWTAPEQIGPAAPDDVSTVIKFGSSIGVMWSDQQVLGGEAYRFRVRGPVSWGPIENASLGNKLADDHLNVKADAAGNVYAATKTKFFSPEKPQTRLLVRSAATGTLGGLSHLACLQQQDASDRGSGRGAQHHPRLRVGPAHHRRERGVGRRHLREGVPFERDLVRCQLRTTRHARRDPGRHPEQCDGVEAKRHERDRHPCARVERHRAADQDLLAPLRRADRCGPARRWRVHDQGHERSGRARLARLTPT